MNTALYKTKPCKHYHGPAGCPRGDNCHFIHDPQYAGKEIPGFNIFNTNRNINNNIINTSIEENSMNVGNNLGDSNTITSDELNISGKNAQNNNLNLQNNNNAFKINTNNNFNTYMPQMQGQIGGNNIPASNKPQTLPFNSMNHLPNFRNLMPSGNVTMPFPFPFNFNQAHTLSKGNFNNISMQGDSSNKNNEKYS